MQPHRRHWRKSEDTYRHGWRISDQLSIDIFWAELEHERSLESNLRRLSLGCQLQGRFSDLEMLRMHLRNARFNGKFVSADDAAKALFGKPAGALNAEESISLAATYGSPPIQGDPDRWNSRIEYVRERLAGKATEW
jgi:membrane carboxypeptidase/penicillin-binding protein PbpC